MVHKVLVIFFAIYVLGFSLACGLESVLSVENIENTHLQDYPSIEHIVRAHLTHDGPPLQNNIPLNYHHLRRLTALSIRDQTLRNFLIFRGGSLGSLHLYNCQIEDFNSFTFLSGIEELHLRKCQVKDIAPLAKLTELTNLSLTDNHIVDISPLSHCKRLTWLDLRNNRIENVSSFKHLHTLKYVDLRDNPLESESNVGDIQEIKANNPGVRILLGKQSDTSRTHLDQLLSARARIAEFALCGRFQYDGELVGPLLPNVSDEVSEALTCLGKAGNKEHLVDIAALLMKYGNEIMRYYRPGPVWSQGEEPLVDAFVDGVGIKIGLEGIPMQYIVNWIRDNRDQLAPSIFLNTQIEKYDILLFELKREGIFGSSDTE